MDYYLSAVSLLLLLLAYTLYLAVYRIYLCPIAHFPGRKLAALTYWYEFYYDGIHRGQYTYEIKRMHDKYGPIVRINPDEVHINDPEFYDTVYCLGKRVDKSTRFCRIVEVPHSGMMTPDHFLHRQRREPLNPYFSKRAVNKLEPLIKKYTDRLLSRFEEVRAKTGNPIILNHAFAALTADIISDYSFGYPQGHLEAPDFCPSWHKLFYEANNLGAFKKHFGNGYTVTKRLPIWFLKMLDPGIGHVLALQRRITQQLLQVRAEVESGAKGGERTIFHDIIESQELPSEEKTVERLMEEGATVLSAGTITTAEILSVMCYQLLTNTTILARLQGELLALVNAKSRQSLHDLEQLPYLTAVVKEGLRFAYGFVQRLPRIFPDEAIQFKQWSIPPGTAISMSCMLIHDNQDVFPEPRTFIPDRWLGRESQRLEKYIVSFTKGSRQCLGINLAYAELYMTIAALFTPGRMKLELFETTERDVEIVADILIPGYRKDSNGVRVVTSQA